jgi:hypothetical protein
MKKGFFTRLVVCITFLGVCLYFYLSLQNSITQLRINIPKLASKISRIEEENTHFRYEIEKFKSPANLLEIAKKSPFSHLRFPLDSAVVTLKQAKPLRGTEELTGEAIRQKPKIHFATSAPIE